MFNEITTKNTKANTGSFVVFHFVGGGHRTNVILTVDSERYRTVHKVHDNNGIHHSNLIPKHELCVTLRQSAIDLLDLALH